MNDNGVVEILLVEDNPYDVELTLRALKRYNLANKIHVVSDGAEALDFLFANAPCSERNGRSLPKVIFLDLKLPKVDGLEVLRRIRSDEQTKIIPVVVLTSSTEECDLVKSYELGVNSYITKPLNFNKFVDAVAELSLYWLSLNRLPERALEPVLP